MSQAAKPRDSRDSDMNDGIDDLRQRVRHLENKVSELFSEVTGSRREVGTLQEGQRAILSELGKLTVSVTTLQATKSPSMMEVTKGVGGAATAIVSVFAAVVSGILFLISTSDGPKSAAAPDFSRLTTAIERLEKKTAAPTPRRE